MNNSQQFLSARLVGTCKQTIILGILLFSLVICGISGAISCPVSVLHNRNKSGFSLEAFFFSQMVFKTLANLIFLAKAKFLAKVFYFISNKNKINNKVEKVHHCMYINTLIKDTP